MYHKLNKHTYSTNSTHDSKSLDSMGASLEVAKYTERLVPSTRIVSVDSLAPTISPLSKFIAPSANLIGDVTLGANSSVWYGATIRADGNSVSIGDNSNIGDRAVVHIAKIQGDNPTLIGNYVTVQSGAIVHAATLRDYSLVGSGAQILDGSTVGSNSIIQPGAIVAPGTTVPDGEVWSGSPARMVRKVTKEDIESIADSAEDMAGLAALHAAECAKDYQQLAKDEEDYEDETERGEEYWKRDSFVADDDVLGQGAPGRIFDSTLSNPEEGLKVVNKK
jgi:carbonic anhydrase/acetyltransferase-like protein (isoleucine patch superfamily)